MTPRTLDFVRRTKALDEKRNTAARRFIQVLVDRKYDGNVSRAAEAWGVAQPTIADFLNPKKGKGVGINVLDAIAEHEGLFIDEILGRPIPVREQDPHVADLARRFPGRPVLLAFAQTPVWRAATDEQRALVLDQVNRSGGELEIEDYAAELRKARRMQPGERTDVTRDALGRPAGEEDVVEDPDDG